MTSTAVDDFRSGAEAEADRFHRECLLALRDDLGALAALRAASSPAGARLSPRR